MADDDSVSLIPAISGEPRFLESGELHPDGMATDSVLKINEIQQDLMDDMGKPGFSAIYLQPTTELEVFNIKTGKAVEGTKITVDAEGKKLTEKSAQPIIDAFSARDYTEGTEQGVLWQMAYLSGNPNLEIDETQMGAWVNSKPEDTSEVFLGFKTDYSSPDDYEIRTTSGYGWSAAGIAYLEEQGLIETRLEQNKKISEMERRQIPRTKLEN